MMDLYDYTNAHIKQKTNLKTFFYYFLKCIFAVRYIYIFGKSMKYFWSKNGILGPWKEIWEATEIIKNA